MWILAQSITGNPQSGPANRQPAGGTKEPRLPLGLCVCCGLPVGGHGGGADHADLQYRRDEPSLHEISSQVAENAHAVVIRYGADWHRSQGLVVPEQYHFVRAAALQPGVQPGRADLALSARSARSLELWLRPLHGWCRLSNRNPRWKGTVVSRNFRRSVLFGIDTQQQFSPGRAEASSRRAISATSGPELSCAGGAHG